MVNIKGFCLGQPANSAATPLFCQQQIIASLVNAIFANQMPFALPLRVFPVAFSCLMWVSRAPAACIVRLTGLAVWEGATPAPVYPKLARGLGHAAFSANFHGRQSKYARMNASATGATIALPYALSRPTLFFAPLMSGERPNVSGPVRTYPKLSASPSTRRSFVDSTGRHFPSRQ